MSTRRRLAAVAGSVVAATVLVILVAHLAGVRLWSVISGSMEPTVPQGAVVLTVPHPDPVPGEVYLYDHPGFDEPVLHRYYGIADTGDLIFQGDANLLPDQPVRPDQIHGRMIAAVPLPPALESMIGAAALNRGGAMLTTGLTAAGIGVLCGAGWLALSRRPEPLAS